MSSSSYSATPLAEIDIPGLSASRFLLREARLLPLITVECQAIAAAAVAAAAAAPGRRTRAASTGGTPAAGGRQHEGANPRRTSSRNIPAYSTLESLA